MSRRTLPVLFLLSALLMFAFACKTEPQGIGTNKANPGDTPPPEIKAPAPTTTVATGKIGVPECDDYLAKVDACVNASKIPDVARAPYKTAMEQNRKAWLQAASTPQGKASLAAACKKATEDAKTSMKSLNCTF